MSSCLFLVQRQARRKLKLTYKHQWLKQYPFILPKFRNRLFKTYPCKTQASWKLNTPILFLVSYDSSTASSPHSAFSFNLQYPCVSLMSSSNGLRLLSRLPVTSIPPIFPSTMCCRRQFICQMWPIQLVFLLTVCMILLFSFTLCSTSSFLTRSVQLIFSILLQHHIS